VAVPAATLLFAAICDLRLDLQELGRNCCGRRGETTRRLREGSTLPDRIAEVHACVAENVVDERLHVRERSALPETGDKPSVPTREELQDSRAGRSPVAMLETVAAGEGGWRIGELVLNHDVHDAPFVTCNVTCNVTGDAITVKHGQTSGT
jgi:hypothetical protein